MLTEKVLRPDSKGRICLGRLAEGVSSFRVTVEEDHRIVLEPFAEVPAREKWLFENPEAKRSVMRGLDDAVHGRLVDCGSFADAIDE